ncbi:hypothetical protein SDC9_199569 [bioreactor metagenome]|uniref:Uncharacterized protein n=1 Tax=bioreactor metagenome TaxID=1076179 RepID=A0A645IKU3_9ZZZZ
MGVNLPHPQQGNAVLLNLKGGEGAVQPGEVALLIRKRKARVQVPRKPALGDQLNGLIVPVLVILHSPNGDNHRFIHKRCSSTQDLGR